MTAADFNGLVPSLAYYEESCGRSRLLTRGLLTVIAALYRVKFARLRRRRLRLGVGMSRPEARRLRLDKMYSAGAAGALVASLYANPSVRRLPFHFAHSKVFAAWSNFLIAADAAMDEKQMDLRSSASLLCRALSLVRTGLPHPATPDLGAHFPSEYQARFAEAPPEVKEHFYPILPEYEVENYSLEMALDTDGRCKSCNAR